MASVKDIFNNITGAAFLEGGTGSDAFHFSEAPVLDTVIDGGTKTGRVSDAEVSYAGSTLTSQVKYFNQDVIYIDQSMDISNLEFYNIEKIQLADGVELTMTSEQFENAMNSLEYTNGAGATLNPGLLVYGTTGGATEKLTIQVAEGADFQLDDASSARLFRNVNVSIKFSGGDVRYDGTSAAETILGGAGTEYVTSRLGNDIVYAGGGNDLLAGQEGADKLYGEDGDDIFLINRLATTANGGTFTLGKASNGAAEFVSGDVMNGGSGIDELRITATGSSVTPIENTVTLKPWNFIDIEKITIGTNAARGTYPSVQDQMAAGGLTAVTSGTDAININGAALKTSVIYTGNNGANMLVGGSAADEFYGKGGNDILVGGAGADKFYFDTALDALSNVDTINDFKSGIDKLVLDHAIFANLIPGDLKDDNLALAVSAADNNDYLVFNAGKLYYDADGSGTGVAIQICQLIGVTNLSSADILVV